MGQRTRKTIYQSDGTTIDNITIYHYDQMGMLVTETNAQGNLIKDYIWQDGMIPVAQIDNTQDTESIIYLYTDHLMTNRLATDDNQQVVWRWEGEAFGNTPAEELRGVSVNLRFPGQYFDGETDIHYNWNRYYDPSLGRYITSDPIGLDGGNNTYLYGLANVLNYFDPLGLCANPCKVALDEGLDAGDLGGVICCNGKKYSCVWNIQQTGIAKDIVIDCFTKHEDDHHDDIECPECDDGTPTRPYFKDGKDSKTEEVKAYVVTCKCFRQSISKCKGNAECLRQLLEVTMLACSRSMQ